MSAAYALDFPDRHYNSHTKRWMQKDPIGFNGGDTNLYRYVNNDPVNFVDPDGKWAVVLGGGYSGVLGAGVEGSVGIYFGTDKSGSFDAGGFLSSGSGYGVNVGIDAFIGYFPGDTSTISGRSLNYNVGAGPLNFTGFADPTSGNLLGGTLGYGRSTTPLAGSITNSETGIFSIWDAMNSIGNSTKTSTANGCSK